jgi:glycosyltransferase involved in cell wall biosynthesis
VVSRPAVYRCWKLIERFTVPRFRHGYTVNRFIADTYYNLYGVQYEVVRNLPVLETLSPPDKKERVIIYQGAVNEGRCFETLIPAMLNIDAPLHIYGHGNFMEQAQALVKMHKLENKVLFKGSLPPHELRKATRTAYIGVTLFENNGQSNYLSLGNRFADYCHAGLPQVCVNYPAYREINNQYHIAVLIDETDAQSIALAVNALLKDSALYNKLVLNCLQAREHLCWQEEEKIIMHFYGKLFETLD